MAAERRPGARGACSSSHLHPQFEARPPFPAPGRAPSPRPRAPQLPALCSALGPQRLRPDAGLGTGGGARGARAGAADDVEDGFVIGPCWGAPAFLPVGAQRTEDAPCSPFPLRVHLHKHRSRAQARGGGCQRDGRNLGLGGFEMEPTVTLHEFQGHRKDRLRPRPRMSVTLWRERRLCVGYCCAISEQVCVRSTLRDP